MGANCAGRRAGWAWDALDTSPGYATEVALLDRIAGQEAADALRAPYVLGDRNDLAALFAEAGIPSTEIRTHHGTARFPSIRIMVEADVCVWLPLMGVILDGEVNARILLEAEDALSAYVSTEGTITFDSPAHLVLVTKT